MLLWLVITSFSVGILFTQPLSLYLSGLIIRLKIKGKFKYFSYLIIGVLPILWLCLIGFAVLHLFDIKMVKFLLFLIAVLGAVFLTVYLIMKIFKIDLKKSIYVFLIYSVVVTFMSMFITLVISFIFSFPYIHNGITVEDILFSNTENASVGLKGVVTISGKYGYYGTKTGGNIPGGFFIKLDDVSIKKLNFSLLEQGELLQIRNVKEIVSALGITDFENDSDGVLNIKVDNITFTKSNSSYPSRLSGDFVTIVNN